MASAARLEIGSIFAGDFRVIRPLAEGGMGAVYVVEQLSTRKQRALKVVRPDLVRDAKSRERFVLETSSRQRIPAARRVIAPPRRNCDRARRTIRGSSNRRPTRWPRAIPIAPRNYERSRTKSGSSSRVACRSEPHRER